MMSHLILEVNMKKFAALFCMFLFLCSFSMAVRAAEQPASAPAELAPIEPIPTPDQPETETEHAGSPENPWENDMPDDDTTSEAGAVRILFVGNSYTHYNNYFSLFSKLCKKGGHPVYVRHVTKGGHSLTGAANEKDLEGAHLKYLLTTQKWDYVVLQERHHLPIRNPQRTTNAVKKIAPSIREAGAKMVLFMTWVPDKGHKDYRKFRKKVPNRKTYYEKIKTFYETLGEETDALVAPIGTAFYQAQKEFPNIRLIRKDRSHPTKAGSYLSACVMYETIFQESAVGNPYKGSLAAKKAKKLQKTASVVTKNIQESF